jgi:hypothetical protein
MYSQGEQAHLVFDLQLACLSFINVLLCGAKDLAFRCHLRFEMLELGLLLHINVELN